MQTQQEKSYEITVITTVRLLLSKQNSEAACKDKRFANREELNQIQTCGRLFVPFLYRADSCVRLDKHTTNKQTITFSFIVCAFLLRILFETQDRSRNQRQIKKQDGPKTKTVENAEMNIKRLRKHIERHVVQRRLIATPICPRAPVRHANTQRAQSNTAKSDFNKPLHHQASCSSTVWNRSTSTISR